MDVIKIWMIKKLTKIGMIVCYLSTTSSSLVLPFSQTSVQHNSSKKWLCLNVPVRLLERKENQAI